MYGNSACIRWEINAKDMEDFIICNIQKMIDDNAWREELRGELKSLLKVIERKSSDRLCVVDKDIKELSLKIENWKKVIEKGVELDNAVDIINRYVFQRQQ